MDPHILDGILSSPELLEAAAKIAGELLSRAPSPDAVPAPDSGDTDAPAQGKPGQDGAPASAAASDGGDVPAAALLSGLLGGGAASPERGADPDALSALLGLLGVASPSREKSVESADVSALSALLGPPHEGRREAPSSPPALDPKLLSAAAQVLGAVGKDDDRTRLLLALKPLLRREKAERVDRAVRILKVSTAIRAAINSLAGGDKGDVLKI